LPRLVTTLRAQGDLERLPRERLDVVDEKILRVGANPPDEGKHLKGTWHCRWSARVARHCVLYRIEGSASSERVVILGVPPRSRAYPRSRG
jgi:mRNA-degrading endonuclease RelE of RelBE toxin-antitoxin system